MDTPVYDYALTKRDFINAQRLFLRHNRLAGFDYLLWVWLIPILGIVANLLTLTAYVLHQRAMYQQLLPVAFAGACFAILFPAVRWLTIYRAWKSVAEVYAGEPVSLQFNQEQLISTIPGRSEGRFFWKAIGDFAEDGRIALLFVGKKRFIYIPKKVLPEDAWQQIRDLVPRKN